MAGDVLQAGDLLEGIIGAGPVAIDIDVGVRRRLRDRHEIVDQGGERVIAGKQIREDEGVAFGSVEVDNPIEAAEGIGAIENVSVSTCAAFETIETLTGDQHVIPVAAEQKIVT